MKKTRINLKGKKFGKLTVLEYAFTKNNAAYWLCKCDCGNKKIILASSLLQNKTKSCGCLKKDKMTIHNKTNTKLYKTYRNMKTRCYNKNNPIYKHYGARGIVICEEWLIDFINFYNWAINNGYKEGLSIDRIDVNGNYEPSNCRWVDNKIQQNNRRDNKKIKFNNQIHTLSEWAEIVNISKITITTRLNRGWAIERALTEQINKKEKRNATK